MPYTTVVAGTAITASWGNANVRDQVVTPFASAAARAAAVTSPVQGMISYLSDTEALERRTALGYVRVGHVDVQKITSTGNWTKPDGAQILHVRGKGGGGAGGGCKDCDNTTDRQSVGSGGGEGAEFDCWILASSCGATETVTIGAGGAGVDEDDGGAGGQTSFGAHATAPGGAGGQARTASATAYGIAGGAGGTGGSLAATVLAGTTTRGMAGSPGFGLGALLAVSGIGGGPGGGASKCNNASGQVYAGNAGYGAGAGGGGAIGNRNTDGLDGGDGADGVVVVETYC